MQECMQILALLVIFSVKFLSPNSQITHILSKMISSTSVELCPFSILSILFKGFPIYPKN